MGPSGALRTCPACRTALWVPADDAFGERDCPRCGASLWFLGFSNGPAFFVRRPGQSFDEFLTDLAGTRLGLTASELQAVLATADSLDMVEFVMEVEEALQPK